MGILTECTGLRAYSQVMHTCLLCMSIMHDNLSTYLGKWSNKQTAAAAHPALTSYPLQRPERDQHADVGGKDADNGGCEEGSS